MRRVVPALLVLLTACARRDRPYVPSAAAADPAATRLVVKPDGKLEVVARGSKRMLLDAPARFRVRELSPVFAFMYGGGIQEVDALVDTESGTGAVPLRIQRNGAIGYYENLQVRDLCPAPEARAPGAIVRPGPDGEWALMKTGSVTSLGLLGEPLTALPAEAPVPLDSAAFVLLCTSPEDLYQDVVLSLVALERRFPGKVILQRPR